MPAPPVSALKQIENLDPNLVEKVREKFFDEVQKNPNEYDHNDLDEIRNNPWQIQRFLLENHLNYELCIKSLLIAMKWRFEQQVRQLLRYDFPLEYYQSNYIVSYGRDRNDAKVIYFRANIHQKTSEWNPILKKFFLYQIEQIDQDADGKGVTLVIDCNKIGLNNLDLDLLKFIVTTFSKYYPKLFDAIIIHQLPFFLQYVFKLVQQWLPEDDRKFFHMTNEKTIWNHLVPERIPNFFRSLTKEKGDILKENFDNNILSAKRFVESKGKKFGLKINDEKKLNYLNAYV
ncbi:Motile sperm domain-containing protein 2 [Sarcoptes scabiei]|uniref:Motile sperm domain-containing protein 2 n=1 Tax=Sarcoptes scabiei TaxID=52283 RepID=A0A834RDB8_SARSC|nr:Motile sperm domain-containing protein 2 [Sarcoptes scabiei]UXI22641.1 hypothetical protein NH340_JMT08584 [Sarcoptes scabiei]